MRNGSVRSFGLTQRQDQTLRFLCAYRAQHGTAPTVAEIADALGVDSKSNAVRLLKGLEQRGYIRRIPKLRRAIDILIEPDVGAPIVADALSPALQARLLAFCARHNEVPAAVVSDAITLHLDAMDSEEQLRVIQ